MKISSFYIRNILFLALIALVGLQFLWLHSMYRVYQLSMEDQIYQTLVQSIDNEFNERRDQLGGPRSFSFFPIKQDSSYTKKATVVTEDTSFVVSYNSANLYETKKVDQLLLKYVIPLDVYRLDNIFNQLLNNEDIPARKTVIELYDRDSGITTQTGDLSKSFYFQLYETEMIFVDLTDSIGIKAFLQTPYSAILQRMAFQFILSAILIVSVIICLFKLSGTIFQQRKEEQVKKDFINTMTHELKKPISSSLFILDYLKNKVAKSEEEYLVSSILELKRLNLYVEKIQEISEGEEGGVTFKKEDVDLHASFEKLKKQYESLEEKIINITVLIEGNLSLNTDPLHFSNIMENLMENSIKYSGKSVSIRISIFQKDNQIQIIHRDNGWGISESEIDYVFDKFYRGNSAEKRRKNGFGLGLTYIKLMMENMGGSISVCSKEKEFTEFTLNF